MTDFEKWLNKICVTTPSPESRKLARMAWDQAYINGVKSGMNTAFDKVDFMKSPSPSELRH